MRASTLFVVALLAACPKPGDTTSKEPTDQPKTTNAPAPSLFVCQDNRCFEGASAQEDCANSYVAVTAGAACKTTAEAHCFSFTFSSEHGGAAPRRQCYPTEERCSTASGIIAGIHNIKESCAESAALASLPVMEEGGPWYCYPDKKTQSCWSDQAECSNMSKTFNQEDLCKPVDYAYLHVAMRIMADKSLKPEMSVFFTREECELHELTNIYAASAKGEFQQDSPDNKRCIRAKSPKR